MQEKNEEMSEAYYELVKNLDRWLHLLTRRGGSDKHLVELATNAIRRNIESNIAYYRALAKDAEKANDFGTANRFNLIAKLYDAVCKN